MKKIRVAVLLMLLGGSLFAAEIDKTSKEKKINSFKNAINTCPGGMIFGVYSLNYERMISPKNGIVARVDYEAISEKYSGDKYEADGLALILNYRRHLKPSLKSFYIGSYLRLRNYDGRGEAGEEKFDFEIGEFTAGLNIGKRWVWSSGFNLNFMLGYGFACIDKKITPDNDNSNASFDKFEDKYQFEGPLLGELSIGYAF